VRCTKCRYRPIHLWYLIVANFRCRLWRGPIPRWFFDHVGGWRERLSVWLMQGLAYEYGIPTGWDREHCKCRRK